MNSKKYFTTKQTDSSLEVREMKVDMQPFTINFFFFRETSNL